MYYARTSHQAVSLSHLRPSLATMGIMMNARLRESEDKVVVFCNVQSMTQQDMNGTKPCTACFWSSQDRQKREQDWSASRRHL